MAEYKLYCLDRQGRIERRVEFEEAGDEEALAYAREHHPQTSCELWCGTRKVALISPEGRTAA